MSCCPPAPQLIEGDSADFDRPSQDTQILPGESVECYMKRAENPTGLKDDLTGYVPYKIKTTAIPVGPTANVNTKLELTPGDPSPDPGANPPKYHGVATGVTWSMTGNPSWLTLSGDTITGTSPTPDTPIQVGITVTVSGTKDPRDGGGPFADTRAFNFAVVKPSKDNSIQFVNPLPGGRVTSEFNPNRVHPVRGTVSPHKGVDMSTPGAATSDVVAAADGTVTFTGNQAGGAGNYVKIDHFTPTGEYLCQTVYMHLEKWYVSVGQKVAAGQKIGREGNTGIGTAAHLHFECRVKRNGVQTWIDPLPLIRGTIQVHPATNPDNTGAGQPAPVESNASLTTADADARAGGCAAFSPDYPGQRTTSEAVPPSFTSPSGSVFEKAWFFVMKHEVGPHWMTQPQFTPTPPTGSPAGDPELDQGLYETQLQRRKTGYVQHPKDPGGVTKFGVAQGPNPKIDVRGIDYANARKVGYNNYWLKGPSTYEASKPKTAVMLMDMFYLHGAGNVKGSILPRASIESLSDEDSCRALQASQATYFQNLVAAKPDRSVFLKGWMKRSNELLAYALSLTFDAPPPPPAGPPIPPS